jgi:hypothetical protein
MASDDFHSASNALSDLACTTPLLASVASAYLVFAGDLELSGVSTFSNIARSAQCSFESVTATVAI